MSAERNFTDHDYELLSAYLDGALAPAERAALETRLQTDDGLLRELEAVRQTVKLVSSLPGMKAPRNFTLTPSMVGLRQTRWLMFPTSAAFSGLAAAAATILILIGAGLFFLQNSGTNTSVPSVMQTSGLQQEAQTELAFIPTQTALMTEKTAEQEMADQIQASVTAPPFEALSVTQVMLTAESLVGGSVGEAGDGFATAPDSVSPAQSPAAASEISAYQIASPSADEETTQTLPSGVLLGATFNPQATMLPPAQPPAAADSAAQMGGNSTTDDSTQTNAAGADLAAQTVMTVDETTTPTFNREAQVPLTASAPASPAVIAAAGTATPAMTASPSATLSQTPMPTQTPLPVPDESTAEPTATNPADFAPLILLTGFVLLMVAVITTLMRRRG